MIHFWKKTKSNKFITCFSSKVLVTMEIFLAGNQNWIELIKSIASDDHLTWLEILISQTKVQNHIIELYLNMK